MIEERDSMHEEDAEALRDAGEWLGMAAAFVVGFVLGAAVFMFACGAFSGSGRP